MAAFNSPTFLRFRPVPAVRRGQLHYVLGNVAFTSFRRAACAWSAAEADRAEAIELLKQQTGGAR